MIHQLLKNIFGHDAFRSFQKDAVDCIVNKRDLITILPTGGGKSLCYQLPSLVMNGVTVVISPLIALMQDQVRGLKSNEIKAEMISSSQSVEEIEDITKRLLLSEIKLLYVSPERLSSNGFIDLLRKLNINFFVIDEAHCVSEWGHEFRADYRNLNRLKQLFPSTAIAAFTATATKKVQDDIVQTLGLENPLQLRGKTLRDNLMVSSQKRISNGRDQLIGFLSNYKNDSGIVYAFSRKDVEGVAEFLKSKGLRAEAYHAGLSSETRSSVYADFLYDRIDIVVATIAFGMGIDKSNIRFVVHMSMPKTMENYYQEIGRAGRDGLESKTLLLYTKADEMQRRMLIDDLPSQEYKELLYNKLNRMYSYSNSSQCRHKLIANYFDDDLEACGNMCDSCIQGEREQMDITLESMKLLSAIYRCDQKFGLTHIIDVLKGSKVQKIIQFSHDKLSVYGIGNDKSKNEWNAVADRLFEVDAIEIGEFRVIKIKQFGFDILQKKASVFIDMDKTGVAAKKSEIRNSESFLNKNFDKFKALRLELSSKEKVPAYVIFGDKVLSEMSQKLPQTKEAMLKISGIGEVKFEKYGEDFLNLCRELAPSADTALKPLTKTYLETLELIQNSKSLKEIVKIRELQTNTILGHILLLREHEKISTKEKDTLFEDIKNNFNPQIKEWCENGLEITDIQELKQQLFLYQNIFLN